MTLDEHIADAAKNEFNYSDGLRADVCFLTSDGELMRLERVGEARVRSFKKAIWGMGNFIDLT